MFRSHFIPFCQNPNFAVQHTTPEITGCKLCHQEVHNQLKVLEATGHSGEASHRIITDWTVICTVNWSWHPRQLAPVVEKSRPWSMFYKDAPFTKPQEKTCGLSALPWRPNSTAASRSWRRRHHSSPERPWSCRLRTPSRRRNSKCSQT